jgi:2-iminobutanoate/2-iminopropanoate deaminase
MELINNTPHVPAAVGPYSQAVKQGGLLFCSGQIPIDPAAGKIVATDVEGQANQVLSNIRALLTAQGLKMGDVIKISRRSIRSTKQPLKVTNRRVRPWRWRDCRWER